MSAVLQNGKTFRATDSTGPWMSEYFHNIGYNSSLEFCPNISPTHPGVPDCALEHGVEGEYHENVPSPPVHYGAAFNSPCWHLLCYNIYCLSIMWIMYFLLSLKYQDSWPQIYFDLFDFYKILFSLLLCCNTRLGRGTVGRQKLFFRNREVEQ